MVTILAIVNATKEGQIESKMMKSRQMEEIREARRKEAEARQERKKLQLVWTFCKPLLYVLTGLFCRKRLKIPFAAGENASVTLLLNKKMLPLKLKFPKALNQIRSEYRSLNGYSRQTPPDLLIWHDLQLPSRWLK